MSFGSDEMSKYPFLADWGKDIQDQGFTLEQFGTDPDLKKVVDGAYERIQAAADGKIYKTATRSSLENGVFTFLLAVVLLRLSGMGVLVSKFVLAEARRAEKFLEYDLTGDLHEKKGRLAIQLMENFLSVTVSRQGYDFAIAASDYIRHSVNFHEREWKMVNRRVRGGKVLLSSHEAVRLVRQELVGYIRSRINSADTPEMFPMFEEPVQKLVSLARARFPQDNTPTTGKTPPCIQHGMDVLARGENLSHSGRFMLATFLLNRGQSIEQIAPLFKNAPDYNPKVTMYQLNHLAGSSRDGEQYTCPSCDKLRSQGLCHETEECAGIINPLQFGKKRTDA
ncbi:eukaryotic-type DNA primase, large subunit [Cenarchaeum symbiosum A]|uniref:DNA primase large subunit PriL n=1 Tax=Cenarchaeum symbiosum (strain A) TaxID=414004 RepID=A0RYW8_CENSY|nr:eukaryotic-type DNA primase, large subunit [Cenarchaeum symbiosum A]